MLNRELVERWEAKDVPPCPPCGSDAMRSRPTEGGPGDATAVRGSACAHSIRSRSGTHEGPQGIQPAARPR